MGYLSNAFVKGVYCNMIGEYHTFHQFAKPQDGADGVSHCLFCYLYSTVKLMYTNGGNCNVCRHSAKSNPDKP